MPPSALIFAPHGNSYDRWAPGAHAPTGVCMGLREPDRGNPRALQAPPRPAAIEHRVAGGDTNPYLLLTAILGAALAGMEDALDPPPPVTGNAYSLDLPQLPRSWAAAIAEFESSSLIARILPDELVRNFLLTKRQEMRYYEGLSEAERLDLYLDTV
jgi:glutamine synthetase